MWHLTVTAGTTQTAPAEEKHKVRTGVITKIEVQMPPGCRGFVYATVSHRLTQLFPFNPDDQVRTNAETVKGRYFWELKESPAELIVRAWSPSAAFDHVIAVRVEILPKKVASMVPVIDLLSRLLSRMGVFG